MVPSHIDIIGSDSSPTLQITDRSSSSKFRMVDPPPTTTNVRQYQQPKNNSSSIPSLLRSYSPGLDRFSSTYSSSSSNNNNNGRNRTKSKNNNNNEDEPLPESFQPTAYTVILGRGNMAFRSVGYQRLQVIISMHLKRYSNAQSRVERSSIVSSIIEMIQDGVGVDGGCPFVRLDDKTQRWYEVDERTYRERVGSMIRDRLHGQFRSSNRAKLAKRQAKRKETKKAAATAATAAAAPAATAATEESSESEQEAQETK